MRESRQDNPTPEAARDLHPGWLTPAVLVLTLAVVALVAGRFWHIGVRDQWVWPYFERPANWAWAAVALVPLAMFIGLCVFVQRRAELKPIEELAAVLICVLLAATLVYATPLADPAGPYHGVEITASPWMGGYFLESLYVDNAGDYLSGYARYIRTLDVKGPLGHIADHPAGPVLLHAALNRLARLGFVQRSMLGPDAGEMRMLAAVSVGHMWPGVVARAKTLGQPERSATGPLKDFFPAGLTGLFLATHAFQVLAALTVVPVYFLARRLGGPAAAVAAAGFCALIPSLHAFSPFLDQAFCAIAACIMLAGLAALQRRSFALSLLAGLLLFVGLQLTLAFLVIAAMGGIAAGVHAYGLYRAKERLMKPQEWGALAGGVVLGILVPALAIKLWCGYDSFEVWHICYVKHAGFSARFGRTYWPWFLEGPVEGFVFMGVPISCLVVCALVRDLPRWWRPLGKPCALLWACALVLALLHVSGKNRGEVARLWMFLMPFGAVAAGVVAASAQKGRRIITSLYLAALCVQAVVFRASLEVLDLP